MSFFELSHFIKEKSIYDQGFILLPHLATLAFSIGPFGEITDLYSVFIIGAVHLSSSAILALGGIYHALIGPERLEERTYGYLFAYQWEDRFRITAILGAHLLSLGFGSLLLFYYILYSGGLYDTWSSGGGDIRLIKDSSSSQVTTLL